MNKNILILDDDQNVLNAIKRNMHNKGFEISTFSDVGLALEAIQRNIFSLVISDYYLTSSIGTDFLHKVKIISPNTIRVLMTGKADLAIAFEAVNKVNIFRMLIKPFIADELIEVINESLHQFHLQNLERIDNLKNEFFSIISHEFRTPFTVIQNYLELIQYELENYSIADSKIGEYISSVQEGSDRILRTINLIVNLAKAQSENYSLSSSKFNLYENVIIPYYTKYQEFATEKNLNIEIKHSSSDIIINADITHTIEIFCHLLENAIIYTNEGSIEIVLSKSQNKAYLSIIDTGIGITEENIDKIFEPFIQENSGYTRQYEGNGLGLTLVKKYCELNGFKLSVKSIKNKGSIFTITFNESVLE